VVDDVDKLLNEAAAAIQEIMRSSDATGKVVKTIEEIAFQTNILALNAAVEAARAGHAGMGFAVVAEEVRNLAQRCAQAAKETNQLIQNATSAAKKGGVLTTSTQETFKRNVGISEKVRKAVDEISDSVNQQSQGISQITVAVRQIDKVTQGNAASTEETAAAAEQLHSQSKLMKVTVNELIELVGGRIEPDSEDSGRMVVSLVSMTQPSKGAISENRHAASRTISPLVLNSNRQAAIPMAADLKEF